MEEHGNYAEAFAARTSRVAFLHGALTAQPAAGTAPSPAHRQPAPTVSPTQPSEGITYDS